MPNKSSERMVRTVAASLQENMRAENKRTLDDAVSMFALQAKVEPIVEDMLD